jgi:hypothetical protein
MPSRTGADMSSSDPASPPLLDTPLEGLMDSDHPFRQAFVAGSGWAPWLASAGFPPKGPAGQQANPPAGSSKPPDPPAPSATDAEYEQYRRDEEARLDEAYGQWKRSVFTTLFEPWILDRRAAEAARRLRHG